MPNSWVMLRETSEITTSRFTCAGVSSERASTTGVSPETARMLRSRRSAWAGLAARPVTNNASPTEFTRMSLLSPAMCATTVFRVQRLRMDAHRVGAEKAVLLAVDLQRSDVGGAAEHEDVAAVQNFHVRCSRVGHDDVADLFVELQPGRFARGQPDLFRRLHGWRRNGVRAQGANHGDGEKRDASAHCVDSSAAAAMLRNAASS